MKVYKTNDREESYDDYSCGDVNESGGINEYMKTGDKGSFGYEVGGSDIDDGDTNIEGGLVVNILQRVTFSSYISNIFSIRCSQQLTQEKANEGSGGDYDGRTNFERG